MVDELRRVAAELDAVRTLVLGTAEPTPDGSA
jgi:hypothetical protein